MKNLKKMMILSFGLLSILSITSCYDRNDPYSRFYPEERGDWIIGHEKGTNGCSILGLTEEGKKKDVLVLPLEIDGLEIDCIGEKKWHLTSPEIVFDHCKKIYCNSLTPSVHTSISFGDQEIQGYFPLRYTSRIQTSLEDYTNANIFLSKKFFDYNKEKQEYEKEKYHLANIEYQIDVDECYFVDNVESGKIEIIPPTPYKKGYKFDGWYLNSMFTFDGVFIGGGMKWDFDNCLVEDYFNDDNRIVLKAKWDEVEEEI